MDMYVSDLDGTLLGPDSRISPRSLESLNSLIDRGLPFTYATARSLVSARIVTDGLKLRLPAILYNGAMTIDTASGRVISGLRHSPQTIAAVRELTAGDAPLPFAYSMINGRETVSYSRARFNGGMARYLASRPGDRRFREVQCEDALFEGDVFYFTFIGAHAQLAPLYRMAQELGCVVLFQPELGNPDEYWLEIMPAGATKAEAITRLKRELGFDRVVCFGDFPNDASMFAIADEAYAVGNAHPELKALATAVIGDNAHDGVAEFLRSRFGGEGAI